MKNCKRCSNGIQGHYVRATGHEYHVDCFTCIDCHVNVVENFFTLNELLLCERHHFERLNLLCVKCDAPLKGPYIKTKDKKYHLDHFTCSVCPIVFRQNDSYYERNGVIYCPEHYASSFASTCAGCETPVLHNYVEIQHDKILENWHPNCYMLSKLWNIFIKIKESKKFDKNEYSVISAKVSNILQILSSFEEATAECISNMLIQFSNRLFKQGSIQASVFINYIESLLYSVSLIDNLNPTATPKKEAKQLCQRIVYFLAILSKARDPHTKESSTKEMISVVTSLAYSLKLVIRGALTHSLELESEENPDVVSMFISSLEFGAIFPKQNDTNSCLIECSICCESIEEDCYTALRIKFHTKCLKCKTCNIFIDVGNGHEAFYNDSEKGEIPILCSSHTNEFSKPLVKVSKLEQYSALLRDSLSRLCEHLKANLDEIELDEILQKPPTFAHHTSYQTGNNESAIEEGETCTAFEYHGDTILNNSTVNKRMENSESEQDIYISNLSGYEHLIARQLAALSLHSYFGGEFSLNELMKLATSPKPTVWSKLVNVLKSTPKSNTNINGTFGVPIDVMTEINGVETELGPTYVKNKRIPMIIEECVRALQERDLATEGIFRKNGNIKRLKAVCEQLDQDPKNIDFHGDSSVQVAATLKKYLRDLPDPLLTFKLYKVFVATQRLPTELQLKEALQYVCCLLPKPNLDVLMVLMWFLEEVSFHCGKDKEDWGNKMDLDNLATVIAPNILLSQEEAQGVTSGEDPFLGIRVIRQMLKYQLELWKVPETIRKALNEARGSENEIQTEQIIKKYRTELKSRDMIQNGTPKGTQGIVS